MNKLVSTVISALVGGIVGAAVVFFVPVKSNFDTLNVRELNITGQARVISADKKPEVLIKDGGVFATNVLVGARVVGTQIQGHVLIANRMLTSPDNLLMAANTQWQFYTEIGSTKERGGEIIVRSASGAVSGKDLDNTPKDGWALRAWYMDGEKPDVSFLSNKTQEIRPIAILKRVVSQDAGTDKTATSVFADPSAPITSSPLSNPIPNNPLSTANPAAAGVGRPVNTVANPANGSVVSSPVVPNRNITGDVVVPTPNINNLPTTINNPINTTPPNVAGANTVPTQ
ncbi:MAG: hypothetical protein LBJ00_08365 [Planctomycetaceae bacterium]|jgi:hypothetical protein|nr:hypothetical protein [Planctomycetaceae bacterium]